TLEFTKGVITEIRPTHIVTPQEGTRLDILLASPADVVPEYSDGKLTLTVEESAEETGVSRPEEGAVATAAEEKEETPPEPEMQKPALTAPAQHIEDIGMYRRDEKVVVMIKGDGLLKPEIFPVNNKLVMDFEGVSMKASIPEEVVRPLKGIRWGIHDDKVRVVLDFEPDTTFDVVSIGDSVEVSLTSPYTVKEQLQKGARVKQKAVTGAIKAPEGGPKAVYTGTRISLDFQDADIIPIFRLLADVSGYNVVIDPGVKGKITMKLINVPWDQALDLILKTFNLDKEIEGNIIRIAPVSVISREREQKAKMLEAEQKAEPLVTRVFPISYANVGKVRTSIEQAKVLSKRGSISIDERISSLIVKDVESNMPKISKLIKTLDRPTPQVMIEARIVEVNTSATKDFGIRWGTTITSKSRLTTFQGLTPYVVDFPSTSAGPGSGAGFTFGFLNPQQTLGIDLEISALATSGKLKIISNPRIITVDNEEATISQGKSIPVRKLTSEGTVSTEFKDIKLELKVKPHITPEGSIILNVNAKKEELDPTIPSVEGVPGTDKKEAKTNVIIKDGETLVIGGIYKTVNNNSQSGLPVAKDIPILGWLFKNKKKESQTNELLIFITPRIVRSR
ncbi:MAG TPA: type IV pilus secretin PilQ, partial [Nitrospirae bacterium]|nr:type IV pilus secretin PilQ [Nitrospirota bacterium]